MTHTSTEQPEALRYPFSASKEKEEKVNFCDLLKALSYSEETGFFKWNDTHKSHRAGMIAGAKSGRGYIEVTFNGFKYKAHRLAWFFCYGVWPHGQIDHINGDKTDNRIENLRDVNASENQLNQKAKPNKLRGAYFHKDTGKWQSSFRFKNKQHYVGLFETQEDAHQAHLVRLASIRAHGITQEKQG